MKGLLVILIASMIFLSPFLDVKDVSVSSFPTECFLVTVDQNCCKSGKSAMYGV